MKEIEHLYGQGVHIYNSACMNTLLAKFCARSTSNYELGGLMRRMYTRLLEEAVDTQFPHKVSTSTTRMIKHTERGIVHGTFVDSTPTVVVNVLRAGTVPSQVTLEVLMELMPDLVRMDYLVVGRTTNEETHVVTGAKITSAKIDIPRVDGQFLIMADPMGATGGTTITVLDHYMAQHGVPAKVILLHLIVTPEYVHRVQTNYPDAMIFALRLDRGLSPPDVLETIPGTHWDQEVGLTAQGYIVPGGGDIGAEMNGTTI